ncbi:helix-turn-helix domain-containing protein [Paraburkholderia sp.]|uniref:helix-turn-helix domain-containing protein n=1 Tax=Paraburkholderia sp. TaxID=1926495 RepID=UPI0039E71B24
MAKKDQTFTVAEYFGNQIAANQKTLASLSKEIGGIMKPNMLSMVQNGHAKLPIQHVGKVARALNIDPVFFMKLCLREYYPDMWAAVEEVMANTPMLTNNERKFIEELRAVSAEDPVIATEQERREFRKFVSGLRTGTVN